MRVRYFTLRDQPLIVDKDHRLVGRAVGFLLPDRPFWQLIPLRRGVLFGVIGGELQRRIHGRAPDHVAAAAARRLFADIAVVQFGAVHIVIFNFNAGILRFKPFN